MPQLQLPKRLLVLSPHTDDGELAAGGTIARQADDDGETYYVAFSSAEKSLPKGAPRDTLKKECRRATRVLGVPVDHVRILDFEVREFPSSRQDILDEIIKLKEELKPNLVLVPSSNDVHQDHQVVHIEAIRAFKTYASIWGYEHPRNNLSFNFDVLVKLSQRHVKRKLAALECYASQRNRSYFNRAYLRGLLTTHGTQANFEFAEAFELIRALIP